MRFYLVRITCSLLIFIGNTAFAQIVLMDDFQRLDNTSVGPLWTETESSVPSGASVASNQLRMGSTTSGRDYVVADVSTLYNTVFSSNTSLLTWSFNMRQTRTDPSGFDAANYGVAFVLGCATSNFMTGNGYAVVLGNSGTSDNLRLVKFTNGLALNSSMTNIIAPVIDYGADFLTVKVTFNPIGNNWSLFVGSNLVSFTDPATTTYTQLGSTTADATYTGTDLLYLGCFWNHSTSASDFAYFDNINIPSLCSLTPEPTLASNTVSIGTNGANAITLNWARGNGTECLVIGRQGSAVSVAPLDGVSYAANTTFGNGSALASGQFAIYSGSASSATISGLSPTTTYYFSVFEYTGSGCTINYLNTNPGTAVVTTTSCVIASEPTVASSALAVSNLSSNSMDLSWTRGNGSYCILVGKEGSSPTALPSDGFSYAANSIFGVGANTGALEYVLYAGTGNVASITGLNANTAYYFQVYEYNGTGCTSNYLIVPVSVSASTIPAVSYNYYYGNLHSHSDYSDGDMDNVCNGALSANCCYNIANTALNFDYMGLSDHNHNEGPVMTLAKYASGVTEAASYNNSHSDFVALYGMEWGTISTGGHTNIYGIDQLVGWNAGNYSIYCAKGNYASLFNLVANTPNAFATLNHPNTGDFGNLFSIPYNSIFDNAIVGIALRNGPYNSLSTTYNDPSSSNYISFYHNLLSKGYHLGPLADLDNHNSATMGKSSQQRTVLLATSLSKSAIIDAVLNMRFYATDDYNIRVSYNINGSINMGSITSQYSNPSLAISASDPDGDAITSIKIYYGVPGSGSNPTLLTSIANNSTLNFTHNFASGTYYYYAEITESDGNVSWTAPIWYTKNAPLPVQLLSFTGYADKGNNLLIWQTESESNNSHFLLERSIDGYNFKNIAKIKGAGNSIGTRQYEFADYTADAKCNYYRLAQIDYNGKCEYSTVIIIQTKEDLQVEFFPNPAKGKIIIGPTNSESELQIEIINMSGKLCLKKTFIGSGSSELDISALSAGMYLISVKGEYNARTQKLVIGD